LRFDAYFRMSGVQLALMMEAARTSVTSVDIYLTARQYIPEDSELHICKDFFFQCLNEPRTRTVSKLLPLFW
jgi:hypothetical protein